MVHDRLAVWEESVEKPVEDTSTKERVDVADVKAVQRGVISIRAH